MLVAARFYVCDDTMVTNTWREKAETKVQVRIALTIKQNLFQSDESQGHWGDQLLGWVSVRRFWGEAGGDGGREHMVIARTILSFLALRRHLVARYPAEECKKSRYVKEVRRMAVVVESAPASLLVVSGPHQVVRRR